MTTPLTTPNSGTVPKVKYFPVELYCTNMLPNTTYTASVDGINIGPYCKPYGKDLGAALVSDATGKLRAQYMMSINYQTNYLVSPGSSSNNSLLFSSKTIQFTDPLGRISQTYLPVILKTN